MTVLLGHVDEHVVELLERVVVSIAAENGRHLFTLSLICTNVHTLQARTIINEQIGQLERHFIIHHLVDNANIVVGVKQYYPVISPIMCGKEFSIRFFPFSINTHSIPLFKITVSVFYLPSRSFQQTTQSINHSLLSPHFSPPKESYNPKQTARTTS